MPARTRRMRNISRQNARPLSSNSFLLISLTILLLIPYILNVKTQPRALILMVIKAWALAWALATQRKLRKAKKTKKHSTKTFLGIAAFEADVNQPQRSKFSLKSQLYNTNPACSPWVHVLAFVVEQSSPALARDVTTPRSSSSPRNALKKPIIGSTVDTSFTVFFPY
jgi:hypothetical protein